MRKQAALDTIAAAARGCPWLYPLCDSTGDCAIVEAGQRLPPSITNLDPLPLLVNPELKALLPSAKFLAAHNSSQIFRAGMYVRGFDYQVPSGYYDYNRALFARAHVPFNASAFGPSGLVFDTFEDDLTAGLTIANNWFPPLRTGPGDDFVLVSNLALVPEMRLTMMAPFSDQFAKSGDAAQWRYDMLTNQLRARHGQIALDDVFDIIFFLAPDRTPGYWNHTCVAGEPMSAQVEGAVSVATLAGPNPLRLHSKFGYWGDAVVNITLPAYFFD